MKQVGLVVNILANSNRVICNSNLNFAFVKRGCLIRFANDDRIYTVERAIESAYFENFETMAPTKIKIKGDTERNILKGDRYEISYELFSLQSIFGIPQKGKSYKKGDHLYLQGGTPIENKFDGKIQQAVFEVEEITKTGGIKKISIVDNGNYLVVPERKCQLIGGSGEGAILNVEYTPAKKREIIEATVIQTHYTPEETILILNVPLIKGLESGSISARKWELELTEKYKDISKIEVPYEISRDFTPNLKIPFILQNGINPFFIYNQAIRILDDELGKIKKKLDLT